MGKIKDGLKILTAGALIATGSYFTGKYIVYENMFPPPLVGTYDGLENRLKDADGTESEDIQHQMRELATFTNVRRHVYSPLSDGYFGTLSLAGFATAYLMLFGVNEDMKKRKK